PAPGTFQPFTDPSGQESPQAGGYPPAPYPQQGRPEQYVPAGQQGPAGQFAPAGQYGPAGQVAQSRVPAPPGPQGPARPRPDLASWGRRVGAYLIDMSPNYLLMLVLLGGYFGLIVSLLIRVAETGREPEPDLPAITVWAVSSGVLWVIS